MIYSLYKGGVIVPAKNQHYVPRVYTKAWETQVSSLKEPQRFFTGVYYYEKPDLATGDGRNKGSILTTDHTYTVDFNYTFILPYCREIRNEFSDSIKELLKKRGVIAQYNTSAIFFKILLEVEPASKRSGFSYAQNSKRSIE